MKFGPYVVHEHGEAAESHYRPACWMTVACAASIAWPQEDVRINYDSKDYFLRGVRDRGGRRSSPAISIRLDGESESEGMARLLRFCGILGWFKGGYVDLGGYVTGSRPILYSEQMSHASLLLGGGHGFSCNYLPVIQDDEVRRALAFWREGSRLENVHAGYAFLSFFKVIESQFGDDTKARVAWIAAALPTLEGKALDRVRDLQMKVSDVGKYIYDSGRSAIAHAKYSDGRGDPDAPDDRKRFEQDLVIIRELARKFIDGELAVPDEERVRRFRDRLAPLGKLVPIEALTSLKQKAHVGRRQVGIHGLQVSLAHWQREPAAAFSKLHLRVREVVDGCVLAHATSASGNVDVPIELNFSAGRAHVILEALRCREARSQAAIQEAIEVIELQKYLLANGLLDLCLPDGGRVEFEMIIPVNIDITASWEAMDASIAVLKARLQATASG